MLPPREIVGVRRSLSRKLHLEFLEGRSMPSSLAGAVLPSNGGADNLSSRDLRASVPSALVSSARIKGSSTLPNRAAILMSAGLLITSPRAPRGLCSHTYTTLLVNIASSSPGIAIRK